MYENAIEFYIRALQDIVTTLEHHREARTAFEASFLFRAVNDGFLQPITEQEKARLLAECPTSEFLLWQGVIPDVKRNWNAIAWIFPFSQLAEMERSYEIITRADMAAKPWAFARQFWLSCRMRVQEMPLEIPANIVKLRVVGKECQQAMRLLYQYPPNLRYIAKTLLDRASASSYLRKDLKVPIVIGEKLEPCAQLPR